MLSTADLPAVMRPTDTHVCGHPDCGFTTVGGAPIPEQGVPSNA